MQPNHRSKPRKHRRMDSVYQIAEGIKKASLYNEGWFTSKEIGAELAKMGVSVRKESVPPLLAKMVNDGYLKRRSVDDMGNGAWRDNCSVEYLHIPGVKRKKLGRVTKAKVHSGVADSYDDLVNAMSEARAAIKLVEEELRLIEDTMKAMHDKYQKLRELQRVIRDLG